MLNKEKHSIMIPRFSNMSGDNIEVKNETIKNARKSIRKSMINIFHYDEKSWRFSYLKEQFELYLELGHLYEGYALKIQHGYFSLFLLLQIILSSTHFFIVLFTNLKTLQEVMLDLLLYGTVAILPMVGLAFSETMPRRRPNLNLNRMLNTLSGIAFLMLFLVNILVPLVHDWTDLGHFRPAYTTHLVIACYVFFNISKNWIAICLGLFVSAIHGVLLIVITYPQKDTTWNGALSECIYLAIINALGVYFRIMNEFVKRKSILDRRAYVESNRELKFQKNEEEQLMLSIIPAYIINKVRVDMMETVKSLQKNTSISREKPFCNNYIQLHENVTILYADIVNYTAMTTKLTPPEKLVETLNDLFGNFDDASERLKVLRIKFLGDCYYCVSGLPPENNLEHAEACVDLGLEMIKIIRTLRESKDLDIDMRIGVHTGNIRGGVIGKSKWQYDVWSTDVSIANKMETTGKPGKVHITEQTRAQLKKSYNIMPTIEGRTNELLQPHGLKTYLVSPPPTYNKRKSIYNRRSTGALRKLGAVFPPGGKSTTIEELVDPGITFIEQQNLNAARLQQDNESVQQSDCPDEDEFGKELPLARPSVTYKKRESRSKSWHTSTSTDRGSFNPVMRRYTRNASEKRGPAFMDNSINRYNDRLIKTDDEIRQALENMPLSKYDQWMAVVQINPLLLIFKKLSMESVYFQMPDPLFKYYLMGEIVILISIMVIENLTLSNWNWFFQWTDYVGFLTICFLLLILTPICWTSYIWHSFKRTDQKDGQIIIRYITNLYEQYNDPSEKLVPTSKVVRFLYDASELITRNVFIRTGIYLFICALFSTYVLVEMVNCDASTGFDEKSLNIFRIVFKSEQNGTKKCLIPWHMTEACLLTIIMTFVFLRIHVWIKLFVASTITIMYSVLIWNFTGNYFRDSATFNYNVDPAISHIMSIVFLMFTLHLIDRQNDYLNRLDHQWNQKLIEEKDRAEAWKMINFNLLRNILPIHVAERYLEIRKPTELYWESHANVAVIFATVLNTNSDMNEEQFLSVMNEMIGDFDQVLQCDFSDKIEKIKMSNWTYMAACGLSKGKRDSQIKSSNIADFVRTMLRFAVRMMQIVPKVNTECIGQNFQIRIGMSHGPVIAGVVGSKKPLYDIWGDTVNMASRMDSTGEPGRIQVTEKTARVLQSLGIETVFRGNIYVKGKSPKVPTYYVRLDTQRLRNDRECPVFPGDGIQGRLSAAGARASAGGGGVGPADARKSTVWRS